MTLDERLTAVVPDSRQIAWQQTEFYAFICFTVNTFTDREWGDGREDPAVFDPPKLDAEQWIRSVESAGMRGVILICKHHDGFCLWPSRLTDHTVAASPCRHDIVGEVSDACRRHGLKFGVYLSPWDRNCPLYGTGKPYDDFFIGQLTELLTNYGDVFSVWFDGACGEGPNGRKQVYDWPRYYETIRRLQPNACISVCGPDVRWCGNEAGYTREAEWSVVPLRARDTEKVAEKSQQADGSEFRRRRITASDADLGSRELLREEDELCWYPAEVDTSIRPGWFWHRSEDEQVRSFDDLIHVYYNSVGANASLLLNIPPTSEGVFHENDVRRLGEIGDYLRRSFADNIAGEAALTADGEPVGEKVLTDDYDSFWIGSGPEAVLEAEWDGPRNIGHIVLKEAIPMSQRVEAFAVEARIDGAFREIFRSTVVGYKRIIPLEGVTTDCIRIRITDSRVAPTLAFVGIYASVTE